MSLSDLFKNEMEKILIDDAFKLGTVISLNPFIVQFDDTSFYGDRLIINTRLKEYREPVKVITDDSVVSKTIVHPSKFSEGCTVACYGIEYNKACNSYQKYVVLEVVD